MLNALHGCLLLCSIDICYNGQCYRLTDNFRQMIAARWYPETRLFNSVRVRVSSTPFTNGSDSRDFGDTERGYFGDFRCRRRGRAGACRVELTDGDSS